MMLLDVTAVSLLTTPAIIAAIFFQAFIHFLIVLASMRPQVYMMLLGVTAVSLLTMPAIIGACGFLTRDQRALRPCPASNGFFLSVSQLNRALKVLWLEFDIKPYGGT